VPQKTSPAVDETATVVKRASVKLRTGSTFCREGGMRSALFWDITQRMVVISSRRFGTISTTIPCVMSQKMADLICFADEIAQGWNEVTVLQVKTESRYRNWKKSVGLSH
jgi:hypothetical protein